MREDAKVGTPEGRALPRVRVMARAQGARRAGTSIERRGFPRFPFLLDVNLRTLLSAVNPQHPVKSVHGRLQNLSQGGLCILCDESLDATAVVVCEINVPELPVPIPVLANVRWNENRNEGEKCHIYGLQFLP